MILYSLEGVKRARLRRYAKERACYHLIIVGFKRNHPFVFQKNKYKRIKLEDILEHEENVHTKHYISEYIANKLKYKVMRAYEYATIWHENKSGKIGVHEFSCALRANASHNYLLVNAKRRLTSRENLRLIGFPDSFKIVVSDRAIRKQAGNSVAIPMIQAVAEEMMKALQHQPIESTKIKAKNIKFDIEYRRQSELRADKFHLSKECAE